MATSENRERLRGSLEEVLARHARARIAMEERGDGGPPLPGDVFVFAATAELSVLWVVAEHDPGQGRFLAVPADSSLLTGTADVAVPAEARGGALTIRCTYGVWLGREDFERAKRTGFVEPETLELIRQKRAQIEDGKPTGSLIEQETDAELEYLDWMEEIGNAELELFRQIRRREISAFSGAGKTRSPSVVPSPPGQILPSRWVDRARPLGLAASVLLVIALGLLAGVFRQHREIAQLESRLASTGRTGASGRVEAQINVPVVLLDRGGAIRGEAQVMTLPSDSSSLFLIVDVDTPYPSYRLEIRRKAAAEAVWSNDELHLGIEGLVTAFLPLSVLPPGEYELALYGLRQGQTESLQEYALTIDVESSPR